MEFAVLGPKALVAGQISPADVAEAAAQGVTAIVNNRPDGEEPGQPTSAEIEAAARAAGLDYAHLPISAEFSSDKVDVLIDMLTDAPGKVLLFCRSGTRSAYLWALARARGGMDPDDIVRRTAQAGYNTRPLLPLLRRAAG